MSLISLLFPFFPDTCGNKFGMTDKNSSEAGLQKRIIDEVA